MTGVIIEKMILNNFYRKFGAVSNLQKLEQCQLDKWLKCYKYSDLIVLWCKNIVMQSCQNLVRNKRLLGGYFYNSSHIQSCYLCLLARYCQLKTKNIEDIIYQLWKVQNNILNHNNLVWIVNSHQEWFLSLFIILQLDQSKQCYEDDMSWVVQCFIFII